MIIHGNQDQVHELGVVLASSLEDPETQSTFKNEDNTTVETLYSQQNVWTPLLYNLFERATHSSPEFQLSGGTQIQYVGADPLFAQCHAVFSLQLGASGSQLNSQIELGFGRNGALPVDLFRTRQVQYGIARSFVLLHAFVLQPGDLLRVWARNQQSTSVSTLCVHSQIILRGVL